MLSSRMLGLVCVEESIGLCTHDERVSETGKQAGPCILEMDDTVWCARYIIT